MNIVRSKWVAYAAAVFGCAFSTTSATGNTITVNQSNIAQALTSAQPGDHIVLAPAGYGVIVVPRRSWAKPIVIDARKAMMTGIVIRNAAGVTVLGGTLIGSTGNAVHIAESARVTISNMDISGAWRGIVVASSSDVEVKNNKLHGLRIDAIDVVGWRVLVEGNRISDMRPIPGDHPDGIQLWSADGVPTTDVVIRNNSIVGRSQGIFARAPELGLQRISIYNNTMTVGYPNGIVLFDTQVGTVKANTVKSATNGVETKAMVRITGTNILACGNTMPDLPKATPAQPC